MRVFALFRRLLAKSCWSTPRTQCVELRHVVTYDQAPVLDPAEARALLDISNYTGLHERALIALMVYSFARIGQRSA